MGMMRLGGRLLWPWLDLGLVRGSYGTDVLLVSTVV